MESITNIYLLQIIENSFVTDKAVVVAYSEYEAKHICYNRDIYHGGTYFTDRAPKWLNANCDKFIPDRDGVGIVVI